MACDKEYHFPLEVSLSVTEFSCLISAFYVYGWKLVSEAAHAARMDRLFAEHAG